MFPSHAPSVALSRILLGIYFVSFLILYSESVTVSIIRCILFSFSVDFTYLILNSWNDDIVHLMNKSYFCVDDDFVY